MNIPLVLIVLSSTLGAAFISAFTILIFFFPIETKKILGARIRGIVPRRMNEIMSATVKSGVEHIDFKNLVKKKFINNSAFELLLPEIDQHVDDFLRHRLGKKMPIIGMFIGDSTIRQLKEIFMEELMEIFPLVMEKYAGGIVTHVHIIDLLKENLASSSSLYLKRAIYSVIAKDLRCTVVISALFGLIIGIAQALIVVFVY